MLTQLETPKSGVLQEDKKRALGNWQNEEDKALDSPKSISGASNLDTKHVLSCLSEEILGLG